MIQGEESGQGYPRKSIPQTQAAAVRIIAMPASQGIEIKEIINAVIERMVTVSAYAP